MFPTISVGVALVLAAVYAADKKPTNKSTIIWDKVTMSSLKPMIGDTDKYVVEACNTIKPDDYEALGEYVRSRLMKKYDKLLWNIVVSEANNDYAFNLWEEYMGAAVYLATCNGSRFLVWGNWQNYNRDFFIP